MEPAPPGLTFTGGTSEGDKSMDAFWMWAATKWAAFSTWCDQPATNGLIPTVAALVIVLFIMLRS